MTATDLEFKLKELCWVRESEGRLYLTLEGLEGFLKTFQGREMKVIHFECGRAVEPEMTFISRDLDTHTTKYKCPACGEVIIIQEVVKG